MTQLSSTPWSLDAFHVGTDEIDRTLRSAIQSIDSTFGDGYSRDNPMLVAAFLQAAVTPRYDLPLMGSTFSGISEALRMIAEAIAV